MTLKGKKFIFLMVPPWDGVWTRQNHFSIRLANEGAEVLYIETPRAWTSLIKQKKYGELFRFKPVSREVHPGVYVLQLPVQIPGALESDIIAGLNAGIAASFIKKWVKNRGWAKYVAWCRVPGSVFTLKKLDPFFTVYDVTDDYDLYAATPHIRQKTNGREAAMGQAADRIFVTSELLKDKSTLPAAKVKHLPNGVDYDVFSKVTDAAQPVNAEVAAVPGPVVGYIGLTSYWMDFELLKKLDDRFSGHMVMVGPVAAQVQDKIANFKNIKWIDLVPQKELPSYIKGFDVCIMPHLVNELRQKANPLKIWEYLATGKPFVSVDLPALGPGRKYIYVANGHDDFIKKVEDIINNGEDTALVSERQKVAYQFSWDKLYENMKEYLYI